MIPLTPEYLRAERPVNGVLCLDAAHGEILATALELADIAARSDIEIACLPVQIDGGLWYDTLMLDIESDDALSTEAVALCVKYLTDRDLIELSPDMPRLVRFKQ